MAVKISKDLWIAILLVIVALMGIEIVYLVYHNQKLQSIIEDPKKFFKVASEKQTVPAFTAVDVEGNDIDLRYSPDGPFTVLFWFSPGCNVCDQNYDFWNRIYADTPPEKVRFYGMCAGYPEEAYQYVHDNGLTFPVINVTEPFILDSYGGNVMPQTMLISPEGTVLGTWPGILEKDQEDKILSFLKQFHS